MKENLDKFVGGVKTTFAGFKLWQQMLIILVVIFCCVWASNTTMFAVTGIPVTAITTDGKIVKIDPAAAMVHRGPFGGVTVTVEEHRFFSHDRYYAYHPLVAPVDGVKFHEVVLAEYQQMQHHH